jgi:hypothetical protein
MARSSPRISAPYAFAYFFTDGEEAATRPSPCTGATIGRAKRHPVAQAICVWALAATLGEARRLLATRNSGAWASSAGSALRCSDRTKPRPHPYSVPSDRPSRRCAVALVGTADEVATRLTELARRFSSTSWSSSRGRSDAQPRHRSYELLADAFGLG